MIDLFCCHLLGPKRNKTKQTSGRGALGVKTDGACAKGVQAFEATGHMSLAALMEKLIKLKGVGVFYIHF